MWLFYSPFHDFVHKLRVVAAEAGRNAAIELVASFPFRDLDGNWVRGRYETGTLNPLGEVPFLVLDDGRVLYSSQVAVEYLARGTPLVPVSVPALDDCRRRLALGDGLFSAAVAVSMERWQPEAAQRAALFERMLGKIERGFAALDAELDASRGFDFGDAGILQGVSYVDCSLAKAAGPGAFAADWRQRWPQLGAWFDEACSRPSVRGHFRQPFAGDTSPERHAAVVAEIEALRS